MQWRVQVPKLGVLEAAVVQPAGGIGDGHRVPLEYQAVSHCIPRQPRLRPRQAALLAQQLVHQGRLALHFHPPQLMKSVAEVQHR